MSEDIDKGADLVHAINFWIDTTLVRSASEDEIEEGDTLSPATPFRGVNIGNSDKVRLLDFIDAIDAELGIKAIHNYMLLQPGDVSARWVDASMLQRLTG